VKLLPENKKKIVWSAVIIVVSVGGIVYINFFAGSASSNRLPADTVFPPAVGLSELPGAQEPLSVPISAGTGLLPYGAELNISILQSEEFQSLKPDTGVSVNKEELGKDDPFGD